MSNWYPPNEIIFSQPQILFLIEYLELLGDGIYPPDPSIIGYINIPSGQPSQHAYWETAVILYSEVTFRLARAGIEGKLLLAQVKAEIPLSDEARRALRYISGYKRKRMSYQDWQKQRRYLGHKMFGR